RYLQTEAEVQLDVLEAAREVPIVSDLVRRLMVVLGLPLLALLAPPPLGAPDEVQAAAEVGRRDTELREVELVRAIEEPAIGEHVGLHGPLLGPRQCRQQPIERGLPHANHR